MSLQAYIEAISGRTDFLNEKISELEISFQEFKNPLFSKNLSGFELIACDVLKLGETYVEKLASSAGRIAKGMLSKAHMAYYAKQSDYTVGLRKDLIEHFHYMQANIELNCKKADGSSVGFYADTKLDQTFGYLKNFLQALQETHSILQGLIRSHLSHEDTETYYLDNYQPENVLQSVSIEPRIATTHQQAAPSGRPDNIIELSDKLLYDRTTHDFIDIRDLNRRYSIDSNASRMLFMDMLIENKPAQTHLSYKKIAQRLGFRTGRFGSGSKNPNERKIEKKVQDLKAEISRGIREELGSEFDGFISSNLGYRLKKLV